MMANCEIPCVNTAVLTVTSELKWPACDMVSLAKSSENNSDVRSSLQVFRDS